MGSSNVPPSSTSTSLLSRIRNADDHEAWREFEIRYRELLLRFCRRRGMQYADADDIVQTVFINFSKSLAQFAYDPQRGRFRDYLYRSMRNAIGMHRRRSMGRFEALDTCVEPCAESPDAAGDGVDLALWQEEWVAHHYRLAMGRIRGEFEQRNLEIFERIVQGESVADLARDFGLNEPAIYATRRRIRLRLQELIDEQVREEDQFDGTASG